MAVDRWAADAEFVGDLLHGVRSSAVRADRVVHVLRDLGLARRERGLLAAGASACAGGVKAVAGTLRHQGVLELGNRAEDLQNIRPTAVDVSMP